MSSFNDLNITPDEKDLKGECLELIKKIEEAYKIYKISEMFLRDVSDDYGKQKIAKLRLDFASHRLNHLLEEARDKGIGINDIEIMKNFFNSGIWTATDCQYIQKDD